MEEFSQILSKLRADFVDIFYEERNSTQLMMEENKVQKSSHTYDKGLGVRLIEDGKIRYAFTNDLTKNGIDELVSSLRKKQDYEAPIDLKKSPYLCKFTIRIYPNSVSEEEKLKYIKRANDLAWKRDSRIRQVRVLFSDTIQKIKIANSEGVFTEEERVYTLFLIHVVAHKEGVIQTGYEVVGGYRGIELFEEVSPEELTLKAADRALMMLSARRIKGGRMPVVISSEAGGTMIHEAVGHGLEADLVQEGLSVFAGKIGQKIASESITVIDDPTIPNLRGSYIFDDEGTLAKRNVLIERGVLVNYLYDRFTAMKEGKSSTGHGRRQSYEHYPIPRMANTYIAPGTLSPQEIVKSVERGLFVKKMGGGQVNTVTGEFVFEVQEGYMIEKGEIGEPVRGALLIGTGQEVLRSIDMVGRDLGFSIGTCGKNSQGVPVTDGMPTVRIPELVVGGES